MIDDPWSGDRLNRQSTGEHLIKVLLERYEARKALGAGSYILNIDASWGEGKTFFLECLRADLRSRGHAVAYVNAWQDDHGDDPLVTVMSAIEEELAPFFKDEKAAKAKMEKGKKALSIVAQETTKQVGLHFLKLATGIAADKTLEKLREAGALGDDVKVDDKALDGGSEKVWEKALENLIPKRVAEHQRANKSSAEFRERTNEAISALFAKNMKEPMFVFVDELDRCRPLYAIRLLEDLKHLFAIKGVVFVVATDSAQLSHSVKAIYGAEFEARKYLRRFFDRVFVFPEADRKDFITHLLASHGIDWLMRFHQTGGLDTLAIFTSWADGYGLSNRDVEQCMEIVSTFVTSWDHKEKIEPIYLLTLTWLFYVKNVVGLDKASNAAALESEISQWRLVLEYWDSRAGEASQEFEAARLHTMAHKAGWTKMIDIHGRSGSPYAAYLYAERQSRFPHGIKSNEAAVSHLSEYPSRIRNAGRVVKD